MIKERIRGVNRISKELSISRLNMSLSRLGAEWSKGQHKERLYDICTNIAEVIVAFTEESQGKEWTRNKAVANAKKFDLGVLDVLHRGVGHHEFLWVEIIESDKLNFSCLIDTLEYFHKIAVVNKETLKTLITRGALIMAQLLHVCGLSEIDIRSF